jgi:redox-sensitive bicupin YhaK (pirin superfamily)
MIKHRPHTTRKAMGNHWIQTQRSFSNNTYWDTNYINYSLLEVINDDRVQPHSFVPIHQHMDMEILGYVIEGPCYHNDNQRNILEIPSGGVQHMTAGTGIWHIEGNNSSHPIRYLQLWLRPNKMGISPKYDFKIFPKQDKLNKLCPIASQTGSPITIQSDAIVEAGIFTQDFTDTLETDRKYYIYIVYGTITINGTPCVEGDAMIFEEESLLKITDANESEIIVFNLP